MNTIKRLYKSKTDRVLAGVIGGIAEFFNLDSTILRVGWLLIVVFTGFVPGLVAYIVAALIVPRGV